MSDEIDLDVITPDVDGRSSVGRGPGESEPPFANADVVVDAEALTGEEALDGEPVDAMPVLVQARPVTTPAPLALPAVQAAAVAATGFVAGAATLALVRRHTARRLARRSPPRRAVDMLPIVGSRTFIVDVHMLAKPGE